ncbi:hypothetical protein [Streptomyces sp. NBC_00566]|uniref:hypothetical protein n=1 Tax=Streptomyces sp. NBC_00566 TaxID=2975778 RepID=UPI002E815AA1|nr:hypothetical protein [Streptomyces sp. NBC_00566]WUB88873.1 hypothetical protein OG812_20785 [Streptomyces sp. NBC_00566]
MRADDITDYHLARLLILLSYFGRPGTGGLDGLTKLAKLDFLLRYPSFTDRLLASRNANWPLGCEPSSDEMQAVESRMIRYKYGPWDNRYYPLLGQLVGCGLAETVKGRGRVAIRLTESGVGLADALAHSEEWHVYAGRSEMLSKRFNLTGNALKKMIYESLPEAVDIPHWGEI